MSNYAKADTKTQWFEDKFPGAPMNLVAANTVLVLHTTEGTGWDDYAGGSIAPTYTGQPPLGRKKGAWRAHFPDERSARALVNAAGGVETNTMNCVQVELIGTCDPAHAKTWGSLKAGVDYVYWPGATDTQLKWLADFIADMHTRHGLKLVAPTFKPYPASYGANGVRFTGAQWSKFAGICGHQHVPENVHGDPGAFPVERLLTFVHALVDPAPAARKPAPKPPVKKPSPKPVATRSVLMCVDTNVDARAKEFRSYYATTFPGSSLCWDVRTPVLNTHDTRLIDAMLGWGLTFHDPRVTTAVNIGFGKRVHKPAGLDHKGIVTYVQAGGMTVKVAYQSLNAKRNADGSWQAPTSVVAPWLAALAGAVDAVVCDEAQTPNIAKTLRKALGKGWTVRRSGEYMVATRNMFFEPKASPLVWVLSKVPHLIGWRQDHAGQFEYALTNGHPFLFVPNHAPSGVENGTRWKPGKQTQAHKSGDVALHARIQKWLGQ